MKQKSYKVNSYKMNNNGKSDNKIGGGSTTIGGNFLVR